MKGLKISSSEPGLLPVHYKPYQKVFLLRTKTPTPDQCLRNRLCKLEYHLGSPLHQIIYPAQENSEGPHKDSVNTGAIQNKTQHPSHKVNEDANQQNIQYLDALILVIQNMFKKLLQAGQPHNLFSNLISLYKLLTNIDFHKN